MERKQIFVSHISKATTLAVAFKERFVADRGGQEMAR